MKGFDEKLGLLLFSTLFAYILAFTKTAPQSIKAKLNSPGYNRENSMLNKIRTIQK